MQGLCISSLIDTLVTRGIHTLSLGCFNDASEERDDTRRVSYAHP